MKIHHSFTFNMASAGSESLEKVRNFENGSRNFTKIFKKFGKKNELRKFFLLILQGATTKFQEPMENEMSGAIYVLSVQVC